MASLVKKTSRGHEYYQIVQSKRIDGKPHAIVLEHLGSLEHIAEVFKGTFHPEIYVKSYSHGLVAALLATASRLGLVEILNRHVQSSRSYFADKPTSNGLTVGGSLLLAAMGRVCSPTSKRGWADWATGTSLSYLLRHDLSGLDSQHFWDMMDSFPASAIDDAYEEILLAVKREFGLSLDTVMYDATNFYTYISSDNERCQIARRGKNKQKRSDLRQVGLAMSVTRNDLIPVFFEIYQGNLNDVSIFASVLSKHRERLAALGGPGHSHTVVFDRGNNSKANLAAVAEGGSHYVGALSPCHHRQLMEEATENSSPRETVDIGGQTLDVFRTRREIWDADRTVLVYVSKGLRKGKIAELNREAEKVRARLEAENTRLASKRTKLFTEAELNWRIERMVKMRGCSTALWEWTLTHREDGGTVIKFEMNADRYNEVVDKSGYRIIMTDHHDWPTRDIIMAYHGQADVEHSFKELKNSYHLAIRPEFHWTDQKIKVHIFCCVIGYLLVALIWKKLRNDVGFAGCIDNALDKLNSIRLAAVTVAKNNRGQSNLNYQLEVLSLEEIAYMNELGIKDDHRIPRHMEGFFKYAEKHS
jgi:transposase